MTVTSPRTNGFLFADLRDYTEFVERRGDRAAAALLEAYRGLVRSAVADFGGAEIKTEGDSFYVVFPSASSAVQCGLAILASAAEHERTGTPIRVGIGVHAGETVETAEGYVGSAVNVAARVCSQARAGELLVTDTVRALTRTLLPVNYLDRRSRRLKGIAEQVVLYRVEAAPTDGASQRAAGPSSVRRALGRAGPFARTAAIVLALVVSGAAGGYLLIAALGSGTGGSPPPGSPSPPATFPSADEAALVQSVPLPIRGSCRRTTDESERLGSVASIRCDLDVAAAAETVWFDRFATDQQLATAFEVTHLRERPPFADCSPTISRGAGNWRIGSTHAGSLMCFQRGGETWIIWSYRADRILARAVRTGATPDDWTDVYAWWEQIRLFQR